MKEKNADRIAPGCIAVGCKVQNLRSDAGILHAGHFFSPFFDSTLKVPSDSLFQPAVIDGRCALDRVRIGLPRARWSYPIVSHR